MASWEGSWEVEFPATTADELLLAIVIRDLVHGSSFDVEGEESGEVLEVDFVAGDEIEEEKYRLLIAAQVEGPENNEMLQAFTEQILDELVDEAEALIGERQELGSTALDGLAFRAVPEDEERWDLVIPDWLAPDEAEVPFGFRPIVEETGEAWPADSVIDGHGRVILVPFGGEAHLYGIPAPAAAADDDE